MNTPTKETISKDALFELCRMLKTARRATDELEVITNENPNVLNIGAQVYVIGDNIDQFLMQIDYPNWDKPEAYDDKGNWAIVED